MTSLLELGPIEPVADKSAFRDRVSECLDDPRIKGYFRLDIFTRDDIIEAILNVSYEQGRQRESYDALVKARAKCQRIMGRNHAIFLDGTVNFKTITSLVCATAFVILLSLAVFFSSVAGWLVILGCAILTGVGIWLFSIAITRRVSGSVNYALSFACLSVAACAAVLPPVLANVSYNLGILLIALICACSVGFALSDEHTFPQSKQILKVINQDLSFHSLKKEAIGLKEKWLLDCEEDVIHTQAVFAINTLLGKDKDHFLVEQDSEGLRKLRDLSFTVSTKTERRLIGALAQMDGGSIALAGPRGAGKTTLLRKLAHSLVGGINNLQPGIYIYVSAPAEYTPRDFIAEVLQALCEQYLIRVRRSFPQPIYGNRSRFGVRYAIRRLLKIIRLLLSSVILVATIAGALWPALRVIVYTHYHYRTIYHSVLNALRDWSDDNYADVLKFLHANIKTHTSWMALEIVPRISIVFIAFMLLYSSSWKWKYYVLPRREPALAKRARDYLFRLQVDKTITWGSGLSLPLVRGSVLNMNRGGSASYAPWTLPELIRHTRRFMLEISREFADSSHAVVIGIDEIDRIGSLEHAERFIGEIKAIFGVEKCFFAVAVAEDVGSIFAQRATMGRSILENAFDDILIVDRLDLLEARDLLLKRVPGFTDSFVYLVHALSGGLPRELIRVTRRLVEMNEEMRVSARKSGRRPRLENLTSGLVQEAIVEAIRAVRNQLSQLALPGEWAELFEKLQRASVTLASTSPFFMNITFPIIVELGETTIPGYAAGRPAEGSTASDDLDHARRIVRDFTAFVNFGIAVIEAFSDKYFDLQVVQDLTANGSIGSYNELAAARAELTVSADNSQEMIRRFRDSLRAHEV